MTMVAFAQQKKVAVYVTGEQSGVTKILGDQLVSAFSKSSEYVAIERSRSFLAELSKEQSYQRSGAVDDVEISRLGKQFGVQYVCVANIAEAFGKQYVSTRLINVENAEVVGTANEYSEMNSMEELIRVSNVLKSQLLGNGSGNSYFSTGNSYVQQNDSIITITVGNVSFEMVKVEAGSFIMGCTLEQERDSYCHDRERPCHCVTISSDYYIGKFEVTQELYKTVMGTNPSKWKSFDRPVENVSWNDAQKFCAELSSMTGRRFSLPTEAEWEYAARGGKKSTGTTYSGSSIVDNVAWYNNNSGRQTHPVGKLRPNELGIYDMSGNVNEWCLDWFGGYHRRKQTDPKGPTSGDNRVWRGGGWGMDASGCRIADRGFAFPSDERDGLGFRVVLH